MKFGTGLRHATLTAVIAATFLPMAGRADGNAGSDDHHRRIRHVVVISVDGLHQTDLEAYVATHAGSTLAKFVNEGASYPNARTPFPSDSFPGLTAIVTGANPKSAGVYYDDSWNRSLLPAGTTSCEGTTPGVEVTYFEQLDLNLNSIDAGYGVGDLVSLAAIQSNIYKLPKQARDLIDPAQLPVDPGTCKGVNPHSYLRVNTMFEVAKAHGLHTAWSDKHAAYDLVNGPTGAGVDDLFAPEINSLVPGGGGDDWTKDNLNTQFYDKLKVQAVINWARGHDHDGTGRPGVPAIFGMNFQAVSTAQKLNTSHYAGDGGVKGLGGYTNGGTVAGAVVEGALDFIDHQLGRIAAAVDPRDTAIIVSAKHGQSPVDRLQLRLVDDGEVTGALNDAWAKAHPSTTSPLVAFSISDDGMLIWLSDRSQAATDFAQNFLWNYSPLKVGGSDVLGIAAVGTVYSSPTRIKKIAAPGGEARQDRHVPILLWGPGVHHLQVHGRIETTQIAPTVLELLGLPARELEAVRLEHTKPLPGVRRHDTDD